MASANIDSSLYFVVLYTCEHLETINVCLYLKLATGYISSSCLRRTCLDDKINVIAASTHKHALGNSVKIIAVLRLPFVELRTVSRIYHFFLLLFLLHFFSFLFFLPLILTMPKSRFTDSPQTQFFSFGFRAYSS